MRHGGWAYVVIVGAGLSHHLKCVVSIKRRGMRVKGVAEVDESELAKRSKNGE
jgi:hypothetical protein